MKKIVAVVSVACSAAIAVVAVPFHSADAQVRPQPAPVFKIIPTFSCAASVSGTSGTVTITKTNAATLDKTLDVVAVVNTPNGKTSAAVCGSAFTSAATGTQTKATFTAPTTTDKSWIYTCSASQTKTTSACNPPR